MSVTRFLAAAAVPLLALSGLGADGRVPLVDAVKRLDRFAVRALLPRVDVNLPEVDGTTALHWAVHRDDVAMVDLLLRAKANARTANRYGVTPLSLAAASGNGLIVERLLKAGADPNSRLSGVETVLMTAARTGSPDAIRALLAHGADVKAREATRGQTALMWAAAQNNSAAIRVLVEGGADIHERSREEFKPRRDGVKQGPSNGGKLSAGTQPGQLAPGMAEGLIEFTPLLFAVRAASRDAVETLLQLGANVNDTTPDGTSALIIAILNTHWELAAYLLDHGADPNHDRQGWTALHQLARSRSPSVGQLPPPVATGRISSLELAKRLIAHGAAINTRMTQEMKMDGYRFRVNRLGATPFFLAAKGVDLDLMRLLLANGADPSIPSVVKTTPLMVASGNEMVIQGEDSGSDDDALQAVKLLLDLGATVQTANASGETPLHGAARRGSNAIVQLLLERGAQIDARDKKGLTPLDFALGKVETVLRLQPQTVELLSRLMRERGIAVESDQPFEQAPNNVTR